MGNRNLNLGTINDAIGTFGLEAKESGSLFGMGNQEFRVAIKDGDAKAFEGAFKRHGHEAMTAMLSLLNVTFMSLGELRHAVVDALRDAAAHSPDRDGIVTAILVLAA